MIEADLPPPLSTPSLKSGFQTSVARKVLLILNRRKLKEPRQFCNNILQRKEERASRCWCWLGQSGLSVLQEENITYKIDNKFGARLARHYFASTQQSHYSQLLKQPYHGTACITKTTYQQALCSLLQHPGMFTSDIFSVFTILLLLYCYTICEKDRCYTVCHTIPYHTLYHIPMTAVSNNQQHDYSTHLLDLREWSLLAPTEAMHLQ